MSERTQRGLALVAVSVAWLSGCPAEPEPTPRPGAEQVAALHTLLRDGEGEVDEAGLAFLEEAPPGPIRETLEGYLLSPSAETRWQAARLAAQLGTRSSEPAFRQWAVSRLVRLGLESHQPRMSRAVPAWLLVFEREDFPDAARRPLRRLLGGASSPDWLRVLGLAGYTEELRALGAPLGDEWAEARVSGLPWFQTRRWAIRLSLARSGDREELARALSLARQEQAPEARSDLLTGLAWTGQPQALAWVRSFLWSGVEGVACDALTALALRQGGVQAEVLCDEATLAAAQAAAEAAGQPEPLALGPRLRSVDSGTFTRTCQEGAGFWSRRGALAACVTEQRLALPDGRTRPLAAGALPLADVAEQSGDLLWWAEGGGDWRLTEPGGALLAEGRWDDAPRAALLGEEGAPWFVVPIGDRPSAPLELIGLDRSGEERARARLNLTARPLALTSYAGGVALLLAEELQEITAEGSLLLFDEAGEERLRVDHLRQPQGLATLPDGPIALATADGVVLIDHEAAEVLRRYPDVVLMGPPEASLLVRPEGLFAVGPGARLWWIDHEGETLAWHDLGVPAERAEAGPWRVAWREGERVEVQLASGDQLTVALQDR